MSLPYRLSTEIPTSTQDYINARFDRYGVNLPQMRENFQSYIIASTVNEEPNAPPIRIFNDVDAEATPPWEFHYTNEMFHSPDVPPPVRSKVYCDCEGKCGSNAKSKCACLKRQEEWTKASGGDFKREKGFVYDAFGRVRFAYVPIFECNDLCGCDEECRNRVVQHGRKVQVNIRKTLKKGWGVFNGDNTIHSGTFIGIYSGELITDAEGERRGQKYYKRTYLFDLDCYHLRPLVNRPGEPPKRLSREELQRLDDEWTPKYTVDAFHAGNFTRFLNHSCDPNCNMTAVYINEGNVDKPLLVVFSSREIYPGEELCFSYSGPVDESPQVKDGKETRLSDEIYMVCECGAFNCKG
ncbi:SET domain-containing protein [Fistulina hepatica ATCC 64428]|uniref:SET domain-containing protein n=1 Tax=Fistulina hepatica ATCC 64428 TaxID=1128425 RepID=A0A0D7AGC1_9AGAR|nr:SET domain-containing protein [Fistulina hepatica ATCC 64428]